MFLAAMQGHYDIVQLLIANNAPSDNLVNYKSSKLLSYLIYRFEGGCHCNLCTECNDLHETNHKMKHAEDLQVRKLPRA